MHHKKRRMGVAFIEAAMLGDFRTARAIRTVESGVCLRVIRFGSKASKFSLTVYELTSPLRCPCACFSF
jgi:hypothetical protein